MYKRQKLLNCLQSDNFVENNFLSTHQNPIDDDPTLQELEKIFKITQEIFEGIDEKGHPMSIYKRDIFHDAIPIKSHHTNGKYFGSDSITPHIKEGYTYEQALLKNPTPLLFFKILPNVEMAFYFKLHDGLLTISQKKLLFKKILVTIGAGAKTNVGYGQFSLKPVENNEIIHEIKRTNQRGNENEKDGANQRRKEQFEIKSKYERNIDVEDNNFNKKPTKEITSYPAASEDMLNKIVAATIVWLGQGVIKVLPHYANSIQISINKIPKESSYKVGQTVNVKLLQMEGSDKNGNVSFKQALLIK